MINFDTLFSAIISLSVFYFSSLLGLAIEKYKKTAFRIVPFIIATTSIYMLSLLCTFFVWLGYIPLPNALIAEFKDFFSMFNYENFYIVYLCGVVFPFSFAIICIHDVVAVLVSVFVKVEGIILHIYFAFMLPYLSCMIIYYYLHDRSPFLMAAVSLVLNAVISFIQPILYVIEDKLDDWIIK